MVNGCLRLSNVSVICNVVSPRRTSQKIWGGFLYGVYGQMNYSELIPTVKMETRNPVERFFGSKFPVNCNLYAVMAAWSRKTFKFLINFCVFRKTTAYGEIFKILFRKFSSRLRPMCCVQISWNLAYGKSVKSCVAYSTKKNKNSPGSSAVATARITFKICVDQPPTMYSECSRFHPNRLIFGGVIADRVITAKTCHKVNPIFGRSLYLWAE